MPPHELEDKYGLTADELLDAINRRFRAKVTLEGAVAEVHLYKQLRRLASAGILTNFEEHDLDGQPDCTIWLPNGASGQTIECKNVRDANEAYRSGGRVVAYKVEAQKTRTSNADRSSRFYDVDHFDILAVCLGKKTGLWADFMFVRSRMLLGHGKYAGKIAAMQRVPLPNAEHGTPWCSSLESLLEREPV